MRGNLYVSAAHAGNTDILATQELVAGPDGAPELDIVLRTDGGGVRGTLAPETTRGDTAAVVLLVPESCNRPARVTAVAQGGGFSFSGVAPGSYRLHVLKESVEVEFGSPNALSALAHSGTPVQVNAGEVTQIELRKLSEDIR